MRKGPSFFSVFLTLILVAAIFHLVLQLTFYGSGVEGFAEKGISGFAVSESEGLGLKSLTSKAVLLGEWALILFGMIFVYAKHKINLRKELEDLKAIKKGKNFKSGTELDNLYELLKEVKHFSLANAAKVFDVSEDIAEDWAKTLESSELAELAYPRIGGAELRIKSEVQGKQGFFNVKGDNKTK